jgi:NADH-quinone oxidoreductase subunit L
MLHLLWLVPAVPFASTAILAVLGGRFPRKAVSVLACGSIAVSTIVTGLIAWSFLTTPPPGDAYSQH